MDDSDCPACRAADGPTGVVDRGLRQRERLMVAFRFTYLNLSPSPDPHQLVDIYFCLRT